MRMRAVAWLAVVTCACAACNAILDNHDRVLDDLDASPSPKDSGANPPPPPQPGPQPPPPPPPADATTDDGNQPLVIDVSSTYAAANGALFDYDGGGPQITGFTTFSHPAIVPSPQPSIPSDTYTVIATIQAGQSGEFGILARIQGDQSCVVLGSKFGGTTEPFLASVSSTDWNPSPIGNGASYTFTTNGKYVMKLHVEGTNASGKMWLFGSTEPTGWQVTSASVPWATGRGTGYYVYNTYDTTLLSMTITVP